MFVIEVPCFNLDQIYNSGQAPRWIQIEQSPTKSKYVIPYKDKSLKIEQHRDRFDWTKHRLVMSCTDKEFYDTWFHYFDLGFDYSQLNFKIKKMGGKLKTTAVCGTGIHILLNQDWFEMFVYTKLVEKVGYDKAKVALNHIAETCGVKHKQSMREIGKIVWYEFPSPEMLLENIDSLKRMGRINKWLRRLCEEIVHRDFAYSCHGNWNDLGKLYGGYDVNTFPTFELERIIKKNFKCKADEFADIYLDGIEHKGVVYLYILNFIRNLSKEAK